MAAHPFGRRKVALPSDESLLAAGGPLWVRALAEADGYHTLWREAVAATENLGFSLQAPIGMQVILLPLAAGRAAETRIVAFRSIDNPAQQWADLVKQTAVIGKQGGYSVALRLVFASTHATAPLLGLSYLPFPHGSASDDFDPVDLGSSEEGPFVPRSPSPPARPEQSQQQGRQDYSSQLQEEWGYAGWSAAQPRSG